MPNDNDAFDGRLDLHSNFNDLAWKFSEGSNFARFTQKTRSLNIARRSLTSVFYAIWVLEACQFSAFGLESYARKLIADDTLANYILGFPVTESTEYINLLMAFVVPAFFLGLIHLRKHSPSKLTAGFYAVVIDFTLHLLFLPALVTSVRYFTHRYYTRENDIMSEQFYYDILADFVVFFLSPLYILYTMVDFSISGKRMGTSVAMTSNRSWVLYMASKYFVVVCIVGVGSVDEALADFLQSLLVAICQFASAIYLLYRLPHISMRSNCVRVGAVLACGAVVPVCAYKDIMPSLISDLDIVGMVIFLSSMFAVGYSLPSNVFRMTYGHTLQLRVDSTAGTIDHTFASPAEVELSARMVLEHSKKNNLSLARAIFQRGVEEFPDDAWLRLHFASFLLDKFQDVVHVRALLIQAKYLCGFNIDYRMLWYRLAKIRLSVLEQKEGEESWTFKRDFLAARNLHAAAITRIVSFWRVLLKSSIDVEYLPSMSRGIEVAMDNAVNAYEALLRRFPRSVAVLNAYGRFLENVSLNIPKAEVCYALSRDIQQQEKSDSPNGPNREILMETTSTVHSDGTGTEFSYASKGSILEERRHARARQVQIYRSSVERLSNSAGRSMLLVNTLIAFVIILALISGMYVVVTTILTDRDTANSYVMDCGVRAKMSQEVVSYARRLHRAVVDNDKHLENYYREALRKTTIEMHKIHKRLYEMESGVLKAKRTSELYEVFEALPGTTVAGGPGSQGSSADGYRIQKYNAFELGNAFVRRAIEFSFLPTEDIQQAESSWIFRFLIDAGTTTVISVFMDGASSPELMQRSWSTTTYQALFVFFMLSLLAMRKFLFLPSFLRISNDRLGALNLFKIIPKLAIAKLVHELDIYKQNEKLENGDIFASGVEFKEDNLAKEKTDGHTSDEYDNASNHSSKSRQSVTNHKNMEAILSSSYVSDISQRMPRIIVTALCLIFLVVSPVYLHGSFACEDMNPQLAVDVGAAVNRVTLANRISVLTQEAVVPTATREHKHALVKLILSELPRLIEYNTHLKQHSQASNVWYSWMLSSYYREQKVVSLMYDFNCSPNGVNGTIVCGKSKADAWSGSSVSGAYGSYGLDHQVSRFKDVVNRLENIPIDSLNSTHPVVMEIVNSESFITQLQKLADIYVADATSRYDFAMTMQFYLLLVTAAVAVSVYFIILHPAINELQAESKRTLSMLLLMPPALVKKVPLIREYMEAGSNVDKDQVDRVLEKLERRLRGVMEAVPDVVIIANEQGVISSCNPAITKVFGYEVSEMIGQNVSMLAPDPYKREHATYLSRYLANPGTKRLMGKFREVKGVRKSGEIFPVHLTLGESIFDDARIFIATLKDVTEVRIQEDKVRQSVQGLQNTLKTAMNAIISADHQGLITFWNQKAEDMFGYTRDEIVGQNLKMLMPSPYSDEHDSYVSRYLETGEKRLIGNMRELEAGGTSQVRELVGLTKDGRTFPLEIALSEGWIGEQRMFTGIIQDISMKRELEEAQLAASATEKTTEVTRQFLANMSHEIRTPLNGVIGMTDLLLSTELDSVQHQYASVISNCSQSLLALINDILDVTKIEEGKMELHIDDFDIHQYVDNALNVIAIGCMEKNLEFCAFVSPMVPKVLGGDEKRLGQILRNFCGNSTKFTNDGYVIVSIDATGQQTDDTMEIHVKVTDSGVGIKEEDIQKLFRRFSQVDGSKAMRDGSGLGLIISKELIELMDGDVGVESRFGKGSTFWFKVNVKVPNNPEYPSETMNAMLSGVRVLVVHEMTLIRNMIVKSLEGVGVVAKGVGLSAQAMNIMLQASSQGNPYDVIFIILSEKEPNRLLSLIQELQDIDSLSNLRIVLITPFGKMNQLVFDRQAVDMVFEKPVTQSKLWECVNDVMSRPKVTRASVVEAVPESPVPTPQQPQFTTPSASSAPQVTVTVTPTPSRSAMNSRSSSERPSLPSQMTPPPPERAGRDQRPPSAGTILPPKADSRTPSQVSSSVPAAETSTSGGITATPETVSGQKKEKRTSFRSPPDSPIPPDTPAEDNQKAEPQSAQSSSAPRNPKLPRVHPVDVKLGGAKVSIKPTPPLKSQGLTAPPKKASQSSKDQAASAGPSKTCSILLVEDNKVNQMMASAMIESMKHSIMIANNGAEALDLLNDYNYDLVLMDIQMPGMDGYTATEIIRKKEVTTGEHIPIIAFTAHNSQEERNKATTAGMDDFLTKPVNAATLSATINKWTTQDSG